METNSNLQTVLEHKCALGEGPVWNEETQTIFWLDITQNLIHRYNINQQKHSSFNVGEMVGCIAFREKGGLIAGLQNGIAFIDIENKKVERYQKVIEECNDFMDRFPKSPLVKEIENYITLSQSNIKNISNEPSKTTT